MILFYISNKNFETRQRVGAHGETHPLRDADEHRTKGVAKLRSTLPLPLPPLAPPPRVYGAWLSASRRGVRHGPMPFAVIILLVRPPWRVLSGDSRGGWTRRPRGRLPRLHQSRWTSEREAALGWLCDGARLDGVGCGSLSFEVRRVYLRRSAG